MRLVLSMPAPGGHLVALLNCAAAAVAGAVMGCSGTASATPPVGIGTLTREMSPEISRCVIRREPALVDRWLRTLPGSSQEARLVRGAEAGFTACFDRWGHRQGGWVPQYDTAGMRAALVRALLQARRRDLPADPLPGTDTPWYSGLSGEAEAGNQESIFAADLGACLARKHWRNVLAIIEAVDPKTESLDFAVAWRLESARKREEAAVNSELARIIPSVAGCVPAGARLRIERPRLRSLLEEAAWHMIDSGPFNGR